MRPFSLPYFRSLFVAGGLLAVFLAVSPAHAAFAVPPQFRDGVTIVHSDVMPPVSYVGLNGDPKGFVIDFWQKWAVETGVPVRFHLTNWAEGLDLLKAGEVDIHGGLYLTPERLEYLDYSDNIFPVDVALFTLKGNEIESMGDLQDGVVGVLAKGASEEIVRTDYPQIERHLYSSITAMVKGFVDGEVDAVVTDYPALMYLGGTMGVVKNLKVVEILKHEQLRAAVRKGDAELLDLVARGLAEVDEKERLNILRRWFVREEKSSDTLKWVAGLSLAGLICAVLLLLFGGRSRWRDED